MARMLTLHAFIKNDAESQNLAKFIKDGFRIESWKALLRAGTVYDARITALAHPDDSKRFSSLLLTTAYDGAPGPYQQFFWAELTVFFVLVALAARDDPPFSLSDFKPEQLAALKVAKQAVVDCENATPATFEQTQAAFRDANRALADAMALDEKAQKNGLPKTKFQLFTEWVNRNDLTYLVGSPPEPGAVSTHDLREPPVLSERSNFVNPAVPPGPFPTKTS